MSAVFNLAQITSGKTLAQWRPSNRDVCKPLRLAVVAPTHEPSIPPNEENEPMATRSGVRADIRNALAQGPMSRGAIETALGGKNIATALSQMTIEGQLKRSEKDGETSYALGREPRSKAGKSKPARKIRSKRAKSKRGAFKFSADARRPGRPKKTNAHGGNGAATRDTLIAPALDELRGRLARITAAIAALEQLEA